MHANLAQLGLLSLAGSALAHQPHQHKHQKIHERRVAQANDAPYGFGNATVAGPTAGAPAPPSSEDTTSTLVLTQTVHATQYYTQAPAAQGTTPVQAAEVGAESVDSSAALTTTAEVCEEVTVTVTNAPVTVTVTAGAGGETAAPSSAAPVAPSSFVLPGSSSTIEVGTVAAPASSASSSAIYVVPSSAPAPSAPASSAVGGGASSASSVYVAPSSTAVATSAPAATTEAPSSTVAPTSTVASSTSAAATTSSTPVTGVTNKRGLVWKTFAGVVDQFTSTEVSWGWNWGASAGGTMPSGVEFVPCLWGSRDDDLNGVNSTIKTQVDDGSASAVLSFNEPDVELASGGSNMDAATAAYYHIWNLNQFASKATIVSPSVCNGEGKRDSTGRNQGLDWLADFKTACNGFNQDGSTGSCTVHKLQIHWYSTYAGDLDSMVSYFKEYVQKAYDQFQLNIWITEFSLSGADATTEQEFINQVTSWMSETTYVEKFSYFTADDIVASTNLMSAYTAA